MERDEMIETAKKIDDITKDMSAEENNSVMRIVQGIRESRRTRSFPPSDKIETKTP